jgi:hypothetical protein
MTVAFTKATKTQARLRLALIGPSGSGKTYSALAIATGLGGKVALLDTEHGSASKYAGIFDFDTLALDSFSPETYMEAIGAAEQGGYTTLIIDSLSHAWAGKDGILEFVDKQRAASPTGDAFGTGWRKATPKQNALVDKILAANLHIIATMRSKTEYVAEKQPNGKTAIRKVGLQPVQRDGVEYEFDLCGDLDQENTLIITKSRCPALSGQQIEKPGEQLAATLKAWLTDGAPMPAPKPIPQVVVTIGPSGERIEQPSGNGQAAKPEQSFADYIKDTAALGRFWAWTKTLGISQEDVHAALGVHHLHEVTATVAQVRKIIQSWQVAPADAAPETESPEV